jgi:hypothetical protein
MSDDVLKRARQALANVGRTDPAALDHSKASDLVARARAAVAPQPDVPLPVRPTPAPMPCIERVRLQMTCGATGREFIAIAERRGEQLMLVENEVAQRGRGGNAAPAELLSGSYNIGHGPGWACPLCKSNAPGWTCNCETRSEAFHCGGSRGRRRYCACGRFEDRHLVPVDRIQVRGQSVGSTSGSSPRSGGLPTIRGR